VPTLNPGFFEVHGEHETICPAAVVPDTMQDEAISVTWLSLAAVAITIAGAIFAS
jgi:hypothetical protein